MVVRFACFFALLSLALCSLGQGEFYAELEYDYKKTESMSGGMSKFLPKSSKVYGNDSVQYQRVDFGLFSVLRKARVGFDSVQVFVNILGQKHTFCKLEKDYSTEGFTFKYPDKTTKISGVEIPMAIGLAGEKKFPVYYLPNYPNTLFPRFVNLNGMPLQYKLEGIDEGFDAFVYVKSFAWGLPNNLELVDPKGHKKSTEEEVFSKFGLGK